jgi:hypothetical protein
MTKAGANIGTHYLRIILSSIIPVNIYDHLAK